MPQKPPFYPQETKISCASACLRMVMECAGVSVSEATIRAVSHCDEEEGTTVTNLIKAAHSFGFLNTTAIQLPGDEMAVFANLNDLLTQNIYPIVYLKLLPSRNLPSHAVIVWKVDEQQVFLLDPMPDRGERRLPRHRFIFEWNNANRTLILVER